MKKLTVILLLLALISGGCTARQVTTFVLSTPCEAVVAGGGMVCRNLLETMIEVSMHYPPGTNEPVDELGPEFGDSSKDCIVAENGYKICEDRQIKGL